MDLRSIANSASQLVNANTPVSVQRSSGYTTGAGARQTPTYSAAVSGFAQIQALDGKDLQQLDNISQQGTIRTIFLRGVLAGIIQPDGTGGDLVTTNPGTADAQTWLVVKVLESWPKWTKAAIVLQGGA